VVPYACTPVSATLNSCHFEQLPSMPQAYMLDSFAQRAHDGMLGAVFLFRVDRGHCCAGACWFDCWLPLDMLW
jgi:hypothetical protein